MRRTGNKDENKRILMDLDVVLKSHDCPYIIQCYGAIVTNVSTNTHMHPNVQRRSSMPNWIGILIVCVCVCACRRMCSSPWS